MESRLYSLLLHLLLGHCMVCPWHMIDTTTVFAAVQHLLLASAELHERLVVRFAQDCVQLLCLVEWDVCVNAGCAHDVLLAQVFPLLAVGLVIVASEGGPVRRRVQILVSFAAFV